MTWLAWRHQRTETLIGAVALTLLAAVLVPTGLHMASVFDRNGLAACIPSHTSSCNLAISQFHARFSQIGGLLPWLNLVPGLIGVLLAAPLVLELEHGTYRLAWTQSVTRDRWLAGKLAIALGSALVAGFALTALVTWWRGPLDDLEGRLQTNVFDFEGTVGPAYVLFALALALAIGVVWRRTAPAVLTAFAVYTVGRLFVQLWLRQRYVAPATSTWPVDAHGPNLDRAWVFSITPSNAHGVLPQGFGSAMELCAGPGNALRQVEPRCLAEHGAGYNHAVFHPASRFWLFQGIETALFGGLALVLILFAVWWVRERTA
jgi:hypothetical protein